MCLIVSHENHNDNTTWVVLNSICCKLTPSLPPSLPQLKDVPVEFQKGLKEGEANAKSIKAKSPPPEIQDAEKVEEKVE